MSCPSGPHSAPAHARSSKPASSRVVTGSASRSSSRTATRSRSRRERPGDLGVTRVFALTGFRPTNQHPAGGAHRARRIAGRRGRDRLGDRPQHPLLRLGGSDRRTPLAQPEKDLFIVGAKSYGRAPTFLALTATSRCAASQPTLPATMRPRTAQRACPARHRECAAAAPAASTPKAAAAAPRRPCCRSARAPSPSADGLGKRRLPVGGRPLRVSR